MPVRSHTTCYVCGLNGHIQAHCPHRTSHHSNRPVVSPSRPRRSIDIVSNTSIDKPVTDYIKPVKIHRHSFVKMDRSVNQTSDHYEIVFDVEYEHEPDHIRRVISDTLDSPAGRVILYQYVATWTPAQIDRCNTATVLVSPG